MGGIGSGCWYRYNSKETTESQKCIEIKFLKEQGYLYPGARGTLSWNRNDEPRGSIGFSTLDNGILLNYHHQRYGEDWQQVDELIRFDYTSCNYGGKRTWLLCPACDRRVAIVYGTGKYFLCRHCYDLGYQSQREDYFDRQITKSNNIKKKLGGLFIGVDEPIPDKPKGMHWKTYNRLCQQARFGEDCFEQKLERLMPYL